MTSVVVDPFAGEIQEHNRTPCCTVEYDIDEGGLDACRIEARARDLIELRAKIIAILGAGYEGPISHDEMIADRLITLFAEQVSA